MTSVKIAFRQEEVDATVMMVKKFNQAANRLSSAEIEDTIHRNMNYFLNPNMTANASGTLGFMVLVADEYDDGEYLVRSLDIYFSSALYSDSMGTRHYTQSYRTLID